MAGKLLQLLGLYMAALCYLSPCIHILFAEIWDDVALNFHSPSLGLIQDAWGQSANGNCPELTTYQHDWIIFVWCPHLLTVKKTLNCTVATAHGPRLPRLFSGARLGVFGIIIPVVADYVSFRLSMHRSIRMNFLLLCDACIRED